ncbi:hypothetical protein AB5J72_50435 [Streptomyces sp. CG1]|uniref:hypothetical protein n=1 Tax=Streptomyces sp. CG1 TaxID=1287523 RepID=UPI0034E1A113
MRAEQGEHHVGRALGFLQGVVLAAFLHLAEDASRRRLITATPVLFGLSTGVRRAG